MRPFLIRPLHDESILRHLIVNYDRLSVEVAEYAKSGADIMIKHNWLEQPPGTKDRDKLARKKE